MYLNPGLNQRKSSTDVYDMRRKARGEGAKKHRPLENKASTTICRGLERLGGQTTGGKTWQRSWGGRGGSSARGGRKKRAKGLVGKSMG